MMKLGDLLVRLGKITAAERDEALRAQVLYGGRFGTNVIEITSVDLDDVAQALGRQHQMPVAVQAHFEQGDEALQARLSRYLAARWECVPLARLADDSGRTAIAVCEPLPGHALGEIAAALGTRAEHLVVGVAAELRIRYHLERIYGIDREPRFLRVRGGKLPEIPVPDPATESDADYELPESELELVTEPEASPATATVPEPPPPLASPDRPRVSTLPPPLGEERRRYVAPLGEAAAPPRPAEAAAPLAPPAPSPAAPTGQQALGRLALRRIAVGAPTAPVASAAKATLPEALRAIRGGRDRDRVGDQCVEALRGFAVASLDAAVVLVVRGEVAMGWRGFLRDGELDVAPIVVPLGEASVVAAARRDASAKRSDIAKSRPAAMEQRLIDAIGGPAPTYLLAAPVSIGQHVACVVYAQGHGAMGLAAEVVEGVAAAAGSAFGRLMRAAQR